MRGATTFVSLRQRIQTFVSLRQRIQTTVKNSEGNPEEMGKIVLLARARFRASFATVFLCGAFILFLKGVHQPALTLFVGQCAHLPLHTSVHLSLAPPSNWHNLLVEESSNYTSTLINLLHWNATSPSPCHGETTNSTILEGLPEQKDGKFHFRTGRLHHLTLVAYDKNGKRRCAGGDYFEVDLHDRGNVHYRSRLPTVDFGNGSYGLELMVPSRFAGTFSLEIWLLFGNWHGLDYETDPWVKQSLVLTQELELIVLRDDHRGRSELMDPHKIPHLLQQLALKNLTQCTQADFDRTTWQGRWTRSWFNDACKADDQKRFRCLPEEHYWCEEPWCFGPVGRLESNGWEYSAHCSFKIFQREEAWKCLDGRWFLMWGDSNFQDTIRNMLLFILDWELPAGQTLPNFQLERTYEAGFINPHQYDQLFRVSQLFNGANLVSDDGEGLNTLKHEEHQQKLLAHFNGTRWPDTIFMNSGLHDGEQFKSVEDYASSVDFAIDWWMKLYSRIPADRRPLLIWRTTIAPAGKSRKMKSNPNKMEMYNQVIVEKLQQVRDKFPVRFIDGFDLTFPFHYNNDYSDDGHYGRAPGTYLPPWHGNAHWYFVDVMLAHIMLNAACSSA